MQRDDLLPLVVVPDLGQPIRSLLANLSSAEREQARRLVGVNRRHFALGRLAAHAVIGRALGSAAGYTSVDVLPGPGGRPQAWVDGAIGPISLSISHVSLLAAACAWHSRPGYAAGVDLERVRPTRIAESAYAFSPEERAILSQAPEGPVRAGLAAWAVKEAVWKALGPPQPPNAAVVGIEALNLAAGWAAVEIGPEFLRPFGAAAVHARIAAVEGPNGEYLLAVAEILDRSERGEPP